MRLQKRFRLTTRSGKTKRTTLDDDDDDGDNDLSFCIRHRRRHHRNLMLSSSTPPIKVTTSSHPVRQMIMTINLAHSLCYRSPSRNAKKSNTEIINSSNAQRMRRHIRHSANLQCLNQETAHRVEESSSVIHPNSFKGRPAWHPTMHWTCNRENHRKFRCTWKRRWACRGANAQTKERFF